MKKTHFIFLFGLLTLFTISCDDVMNIDLQGGDNKIVINSIFNGDENLSVTVTQSMNPYDLKAVRELNNATVLLYENDLLKDTLKYKKNPGDTIGRFYSDVTPVTGPEYKILVKDNLGEASSVSSLPDQTPIVYDSAIWMKWTEVEDTINTIRYYFKIIIDDPEGDDYYYLIISCPVYKYNENTGAYEFYTWQNAEIETADLPQTQIFLRNGLLFNDDVFDGTRKIISGTATMYSYPCCYFAERDEDESDLIIDKSKLHVELHTLSEEVWHYNSSYAKKMSSENNIYSEPTTIYNNIENGLGIFGGENLAQVDTEIIY